MALQMRDIFWLAGLLEGEGSFGLRRSKVDGRKYVFPIIALDMTDEDIVRRVAKIFGVTYRGYTFRNPDYKKVWTTRVGNSRAAGWMMTLYSLMGERRHQQIDLALRVWKLPNPKRTIIYPIIRAVGFAIFIPDQRIVYRNMIDAVHEATPGMVTIKIPERKR